MVLGLNEHSTSLVNQVQFGKGPSSLPFFSGVLSMCMVLCDLVVLSIANNVSIEAPAHLGSQVVVEVVALALHSGFGLFSGSQSALL